MVSWGLVWVEPTWLASAESGVGASLAGAVFDLLLAK